VIRLQSEIERLQTLGKIGNFSENKQIQQLETDTKNYEMEIAKCHEELKKNTRSINFDSKRKIRR